MRRASERSRASLEVSSTGGVFERQEASALPPCTSRCNPSRPAAEAAETAPSARPNLQQWASLGVRACSGNAAAHLRSTIPLQVRTVSRVDSASSTHGITFSTNAKSRVCPSSNKSLRSLQNDLIENHRHQKVFQKSLDDFRRDEVRWYFQRDLISARFGGPTIDVLSRYHLLQQPFRK